MSSEEFFRKMKEPVIWGNLLGMLVVACLLFFGVRKGLDIYTHHGEEIEVSNVCGKQASDAIYLLESQELCPIVTDSAYDKSLPPGVILKQKPEAGTRVKEGREIRLTINTSNAPTTPLPDIAGNCSVREAEDRLRQLGFRLTPNEGVAGDKDWVVGIKYRGRQVYAGDMVPYDATLTLQVGVGYHDASDDSLSDDFGDESEGDDVYDYE